MSEPLSLVQQVWDGENYFCQEWDPEIGAATLTRAAFDALFEDRELRPDPPYVVSQATFDRIEEYFRLTGEDKPAIVGDVTNERNE